MHKKNTKLISSVLSLLLLSSLVIAQTPTPEKVFSFSPLILAIPVVIALALVGAAIFIFVKKLPIVIGIVLLVIAAVPGLLFAPAMFMDRVKVNSERIQQTTGLPIAPNVKGFTYKDVSFVKIRKEVNDRGLRNDIWEIHYTTGRSEDIDPGDLWDGNSAEIIRLLTGYGVVFK